MRQFPIEGALRYTVAALATVFALFGTVPAQAEIVTKRQLKVFGGFVIMLLGAAGAVKALAPLPLLMATALTALEFLVAFLQAYVFTMLTCMYLNDALHPGH